jgi:hypothetical protein
MQFTQCELNKYPVETCGHHCRACWNVALWFANDYAIYLEAIDCWQVCGQRYPSADLAEARLDFAAQILLSRWGHNATTPDGAPYSRASVRRALEYLTADLATPQPALTV